MGVGVGVGVGDGVGVGVGVGTEIVPVLIIVNWLCNMPLAGKRIINASIIATAAGSSALVIFLEDILFTARTLTALCSDAY